MQVYEIEQQLQSLDTRIGDDHFELRLKLIETYILFQIHNNQNNIITKINDINSTLLSISGSLQVMENYLNNIGIIMKEHTEFFTHEKEGGEDIEPC